MHRPVPDDVRRFILTSVPSVPYLEAMLLMRAEPATAWDPPMLARRLYLPQARASELLEQLAQAGLVAAGSPGWRWQPPADASARVDEVATHYAENLLAVTELIHSRENRRARQFADAFRLRKEDGKEE